MSDPAALKFCIEILPHVSRSFALNIRVLKRELYRAVLVAYLFCRIVDTVEDAEDIPLPQRNRLLDKYQEFFKSVAVEQARLAEWIDLFGSLDKSVPYERLILNSDSVFAVYADLPRTTQAIIADCVIEMTQGMKKTVNRRHPGQTLQTLSSMAELEEYCYYVAGTVGVMLTRLFATYAHLTEPAATRLQGLQRSFALGLQMTNIIKDCAEDFQRSWCYIPTEHLKGFGVTPATLLNAENQSESLAALDALTEITARHLDKSLEYTLVLPRRQVRMRLFNLWSLFFAIRTLRKCYHNNDLLNPQAKVKISRGEVYLTLIQTTLLATSNSLLRSLYRRLRRKIPS